MGVARRLLALLLAVSSFGLAEVAGAHGHPSAGASGFAFAGAEPGPRALGEGTPCVVCPAVRTWRAGGAPGAEPVLPAPPPRALSARHGPAPAAAGRLVDAAGGPRAPPVSR